MMKEASIFDRYPNKLWDQMYNNSNAKQLRQFMRETRQRQCAYCGLDLLDRFEDWLIWELDHVIPQSFCREKRIDMKWWDDLSNIVPACRACNGICSSYKPAVSKPPQTLDDFFALRNQVFADKKIFILEIRRQKKQTWLESVTAITQGAQ